MESLKRRVGLKVRSHAGRLGRGSWLCSLFRLLHTAAVELRRSLRWKLHLQVRLRDSRLWGLGLGLGLDLGLGLGLDL